MSGGHCIAFRFSVKQQLAQFCIPVILRALKLASVAQLVEQKTLNLLVEGSNPSGGTTLLESLQSEKAMPVGFQALKRLDWMADL